MPSVAGFNPDAALPIEERESVDEPEAEAGPDPEMVRGNCPRCPSVLVSRLDYIPGEGYLLYFQCFAECGYRRVL